MWLVQEASKSTNTKPKATTAMGCEVSKGSRDSIRKGMARNAGSLFGNDLVEEELCVLQRRSRYVGAFAGFYHCVPAGMVDVA